MNVPKMLSFSKPTPDFNRKFFDLYTQKSMVDVTLSADGQFLHAHKVVLAVASSWFEELFDYLNDKHPVIVVKDLTIDQLTHIIEFIYLGAVNIREDEATIFKSTLESFRISLDDFENDDEFPEDEEENCQDEESQVGMDVNDQTQNEEESDRQNDTENNGYFNEKLFELIENEEHSKKDETEDTKSGIKIKTEPEWDEVLVKEETKNESGELLTEMEAPKPKSKPLIIPQSPSITVRSSGLKVSNVQHVKTSPAMTSSIRIRTPANINEKIKLNEPVMRTLKLVQKVPRPSNQQQLPTASPNTSNVNIQELSKRLNKAILIRRVRKSDGSVVSERSPIKIVQGMRLPPTVRPIANRTEDHPRQSVFKCTHCNKAFSVNKRRNAHEKYCFKNPSRPPSQCPFCPMVLCNPTYISTHIRKVHGIDENGKSIKP